MTAVGIGALTICLLTLSRTAAAAIGVSLLAILSWQARRGSILALRLLVVLLA